MAMTPDLSLAREIARAAAGAGGRAYYAGGRVRDRLLGRPCRDADLELHGISPEDLPRLLAPFGKVLRMGESFPICTLAGSGLDIALPVGTDGKPDPCTGPREAARRRDFTCNAMMEDVLTGEVLDFFGGQQDLRARVLRHTDPETFPSDPVRALRAARFSAGLGFSIHPDTLALCSSLPLEGLARERVWEELRRALLESPRPSVFFEALRQMDQLSHWFPQLQALIGVPQPPRYHGEGDVWNHTMLVLDAAAPLASYARDPLGFLLGALTHDFGKALTTAVTPTGIHAYGHETAGLPLAEAFLRNLTDQSSRIAYVLNLVELHMRPNALAAQNSSRKATNRLLDLALDPEALLCLAAADDLGRITQAPHISREAFFRQRLRDYRDCMAAPGVTGRDLLEAGYAPGPDLGRMLDYAHSLALSGLSRQQALRQTLARFPRK